MIGSIKDVPFLFLSGLQDEIVPYVTKPLIIFPARLTLIIFRPAHMKTLYGLCTAPVKIWKDFPEGSHNDTVVEEGYFNAIDEFILVEILGRKTRRKPVGEWSEME